MAVYEYRLTTYKRGARPRSKRLRELGSGSAAGSSSTIVNVSGGSGENVSVNDHYHENKSALDQIGTDADGYLYLDLQKEVTDDQGNTTIERSTEKVRSGYADEAYDLSEDSPVREQFLSRLIDDVAKGNITFEKAIETLDQAFFGASIDENDNAELKNIRKHSYFDCVEFVINRLCEIEARELEENLDKENNLTRHD